MHVEVKADNKRVYLIGDNGLVIANSEQYASLWNAKRMAKKMFPDYPKYVLSKNGSKKSFS